MTVRRDLSGFASSRPAAIPQPFNRDLTWSFYQADTGEGPTREGYQGSPLSPEYRDKVRGALAAWAEVSGMTFTEVANGADVNWRIWFLTLEAGENFRGCGYGTVFGPLRSFATLASYIGEVPNSDEDRIHNLLLREIGHAVLRGHSDILGTVMLPDISGPAERRSLPTKSLRCRRSGGHPGIRHRT